MDGSFPAGLCKDENRNKAVADIQGSVCLMAVSDSDPPAPEVSVQFAGKYGTGDFPPALPSYRLLCFIDCRKEQSVKRPFDRREFILRKLYKSEPEQRQQQQQRAQRKPERAVAR